MVRVLGESFKKKKICFLTIRLVDVAKCISDQSHFFSKNKEQENIENASENYIRVKHSIFVESDSQDLKEGVKRKKKRRKDKTEHDSGEGC